MVRGRKKMLTYLTGFITAVILSLQLLGTSYAAENPMSPICPPTKCHEVG